MEQQDFLKRQIDKFGEVLAKLLGDVLGLESMGKFSECIELVDKTMKSELEMDLNEITSIPKEHFIEKLTLVDVNSGNLDKLADILLIVAKAQQDKKTKNRLIEQVEEIDKYLENNYKTLSFNRYGRSNSSQA